MIFNISRRGFIAGLGIASSSLTLGFSAHAKQIKTLIDLNGYVSIDVDNNVLLTLPKAEMGQGVNTTFAMFLADEGDLDWSKISVQSSNDLSLTGGSGSISGNWRSIRRAGAILRVQLIQAAAEFWQVSADEITAKNSILSYQDKSITYGQLVSKATLLKLPKRLKPKKWDELNLVGKPTITIDAQQKISGELKYTGDIQLDGMLYAAIYHAPFSLEERIKTTYKQLDQIEGLSYNNQISQKGLVIINGAIALLAEDYWQAQKRLDALELHFTDDLTVIDTHKYAKQLNTILKDQSTLENVSIDQYFEIGNLTHSSMETSTCTVGFIDEKWHVWAPTQNANDAMRFAQAGLIVDKPIQLHTMPLGGAFGRRLVNDHVGQAISIAEKSLKPIQLIWSREQEIKHDHYRAMIHARIQVSVDETALSAFKNGTTKLNKAITWLGSVASQDSQLIMGLNPIYRFEDQSIRSGSINTPILNGYWRSVGDFPSAFFNESTMDILADKIGMDPLEMRLALLLPSSKEAKLLTLVAQKANWGKSKYAQGIAVKKTFGTEVAMVVDVSVDNNKLTIHKVVAVVNIGLIMNPSGAKAQVEGSIVFGLTAALYKGVDVENGVTTNSNFHDQKLLTLKQCPEIEVYFVEGGRSPKGLGEAPVPPVAPALMNAIFAATGKRITSLGLEDEFIF
ncbi:MAG: xanthine dehydrogenase family protein molybdopterin-binding subunit [Saccharospirillaceae bacterium]|nr:molybdopterin-dependent oxidoreductase [Pseudomonadales bacterium]NRB78763.1 xanthine dehydrogenase family protein molybdopterin-binding subunit [Saccharospirillaceae bacterium]